MHIRIIMPNNLLMVRTELYLVGNSFGHPGELLLEDRLVNRELRLVLLLGLGGSKYHTLVFVCWLNCHGLLVCQTLKHSKKDPNFNHVDRY